MNSNFVVASDIGGTHITSAVVDINTWQILEDTVSRSHVNSRSDAKSILLSWSSSIASAIERCNATVSRLGIAMPGPFDYENGISLMKNQDKYDALYKLNVCDGIMHSLEMEKDIRFINDAAAFLQGEIFAGNLQQKAKILGITLGTGLGSAVWSQGEKAFDADLWNTPYKESIFEEYLVTRWFTRRFEELTGEREEGFKDILTKHAHTAAFDQLMTEYTISLHDFLRYFSDKHASNTFILGGNITNAWDTIKSYNADKLSQFEIYTGQYAEKAAIIGAASLFTL
ncbi:ROK family protein [Sphingobacterium oryzagri]|uniref:ROK family protein n=1 Tax=Sphingobacterium oryzagri TaxID=3025669 RepID=A0ABY7WNY5_9SPHI|nr:ROK family protein [Sphingobacterium sp. KACC 22765]WDF70136.1 ROK family protein [Sphingobacterium sp. KACC 22765]